MGAWVLRSWVAAALSLAALAGPAWGEGESENSPPGERSTGTFEKQWFFILGTSNYHVRLEEAEEQIDNQLNRTFGSVLPRWKDPITFKDWSDDWRIWDLWAGVGRDIGPKSAWAIYAGGGMGTIENREWYFPLGVPLRVDADFTRRSFFLGSSVSYYPWGKPVKPEGNAKGHGLGRTLKAARPNFEINIGCSHQTKIGDVRLGLLGLERVVRVKQDERYLLGWISPRAAVEVPLTKRDSVDFMVGYTFFNDHEREFNNFLCQAFWRRRF